MAPLQHSLSKQSQPVTQVLDCPEPCDKPHFHLQIYIMKATCVMMLCEFSYLVEQHILHYSCATPVDTNPE